MRNQDTMQEIEAGLRQVTEYLYNIDGDVSPLARARIDALRQLINEEYVGRNRQVSSQLIYDMLKEVL